MEVCKTVAIYTKFFCFVVRLKRFHTFMLTTPSSILDIHLTKLIINLLTLKTMTINIPAFAK